jgi:hypothetical protein
MNLLLHINLNITYKMVHTVAERSQNHAGSSWSEHTGHSSYNLEVIAEKRFHNI